jgi:hypothetical protein
MNGLFTHPDLTTHSFDDIPLHEEVWIMDEQREADVSPPGNDHSDPYPRASPRTLSP